MNLLPPEPTPTRTFEVMIVRGIGEACFRQMLAPFPVSPRRRAVGLKSRLTEGFLMLMALNGAPVSGPRALAPQRTSRAHSLRGDIFHGAADRMQAARPQRLARGTTIEIVGGRHN